MKKILKETSTTDSGTKSFHKMSQIRHDTLKIIKKYRDVFESLAKK